MNKTELIAAVAEKSGLTRKNAERAVNAAFDTITAELKKGEKVQISGFGVFEVKAREARVGRNPRTKEAIQIPASKAPAFKASKALKDMIGE
jgi:DNA-binding protein HU-beta